MRTHTRALVALPVLSLTLVAPALPALADHTDPPGVVALVGSLQSELGCPGDWQPECPATVLREEDGSPGTYRGTFEVPAGSFEYKVALNGSWDENYGAGGAPGGANLGRDFPGGPVTFTYDHATHLISDDLGEVVGDDASAHWLTRRLLAWDLAAQPAAAAFRLHRAARGGMRVVDGAVVGGRSTAVSRVGSGLPDRLADRFPHLAGHDALRLPADLAGDAERLLRGQVLVAAYAEDGTLLDATAVQIPRVVDQVYAGAVDRDLGVTWTRGRPAFALWAPTARSVRLLVDPRGRRGEREVAMRRDRDGVWQVRGPASWRGAAYRYAVQVYVRSEGAVVTNLVTDPYSHGLTVGSRRSVAMDLDAPGTRPRGWHRLRKPALRGPEWQSVYELHVRDFSIGDSTVPRVRRGTYLAFDEPRSDGMRHLRRLARAGLSTVHLLPVNDIASIVERRSARQQPPCDLTSFAPDSPEQQACIARVADTDGFNWGYDPLHYTTPEGSYAVHARGGARTEEFRRMVAGLNRVGLRVVIDVVYNHTPASGQADASILDRIVPGYYQRLDDRGAVETSTCCANTATEHAMMGELMVDSVLTWARDYKVDGFRFDLMGHQPKALMVRLRRELDRLTPARDGVDGRAVSMYGEGWNFGEVADDARFVQATQANLAGTGIATFNDRLRDAVRGGGPFDEDPRRQGFGSGLATDPNGAAVNGTEAEQRERLLLLADQLKVGLAGNLRDYRFTDRTGATVTGAEVDYNGSPAGYTADPQETVTYVEAHDNETLYDSLALKLPQDTAMADRVRLQVLSLATTAFGQGITFWHAGGDLLRSKSLDRNSYNSGDWFNVLDVTGTEHGFGRGLPPAPDNESKWEPYLRPLLADPALRPARSDIRAAHRAALDLLRIRASTPLFHLGTAGQVQRRLDFPLGGPDQDPGVVVMRLRDTAGPDLDPRWEDVVVVFNGSDEDTTQTVPGTAGRAFSLHPVQRHGADAVVRRAQAEDGRFSVPARTAAVFVG